MLYNAVLFTTFDMIQRLGEILLILRVCQTSTDVLLFARVSIVLFRVETRDVFRGAWATGSMRWEAVGDQWKRIMY